MPNKSIKITFSESDLRDLLNGEVFNWTFDDVDVELLKCDYVCSECGEEMDDEDEDLCESCRGE